MLLGRGGVQECVTTASQVKPADTDMYVIKYHNEINMSLIYLYHIANIAGIALLCFWHVCR